MSLVDVSIKKPVAVAMCALALVLYGVLAYLELPRALMPDVSLPVVSVQTVYAGASPSIIETQITKKIEDEVFSIAELDSIRSYSLENVSVVVVMFKWSKDENLALQEVKDKIEAIANDLPSGADKSIISKIDVFSGEPVINLIVEAGAGGGDLSETELYTYASTEIKDRLSQVEGVGIIEVAGGKKREIDIELDKTWVFERFLPVEQVAGLLSRANVSLPGGNAAIDDQDIPVRFNGEFASLEDIDDLDVPTRAGVFKLRQIADVKDTEESVRERTVFFDKSDGKRTENAILLRVKRNPSANTIAVVEGIQKVLPQITAESGSKVSFKVIREDAGFIKDSVNDTFSNLIQGIVFTGLVMLLFLHDWRSTLIISVAMPFSVIATFLVMQWMHISLNLMSLMGLSSAVGTLVANSVVVLENIFRYKDLGLSNTEASSKGTREVIIAVIASTLTNVVVFVPLALTEGLMGRVLGSFAWAVVVSTLFSLAVSFTLTPMLAARVLPGKAAKQGKISAVIEGFFNGLGKRYAASVAFLTRRRLYCGMVVIAVLAAFVLSLFGFTLLKIELAPRGDGGRVQITVELPQGSSLDMTAALLLDIEKRIARYPEVQTILTNLGSAGSLNTDVSIARMEIALSPQKERSRSNAELAQDMTRMLSVVPGAEIKVIPPAEMTISQGEPVDLYLKGSDTVVLARLGNELRRRVEKVDGILNATLNTKTGKQELVFEPKRKQISQDGITVYQVALALRSSLDGLVLTTFRENDQEYDIRVKMRGGDLDDIEDLRNLPVVTNQGIYPLSRYADVHFENSSNMIMRTTKLRTVELTGELLPGYTQGEVLNNVMAVAGEMELPEGYSIVQAGSSEMLGTVTGDMARVFIIAIVLVYMLLAAMLESLTQPLFILATIPLSIIGVTAGCLLTGTVINILSMIGIIMLVGIVVNNAILLLDYYNQLRREGEGVRKALVASCRAKLKPVLMSNIAIILGTIPMALGIGASFAEVRKPMGVIIISGIVASTILTLWLTPALEFLFKGKQK